MSNAEKTLVTVPTYNEMENISLLVEAIFKYLPEADLLVIDDNSPDGTGQWCDKKGAEDPRVHCLHRQGKLGLVLRRHPENVPARHVDIARDPHEDEERPGRLEGVRARVDPVAPLDARGPRRREGPGRLPDQGRAHARYGFRPFRREGADVAGQPVEAVPVFLHERMVVEVFADNDVHHGEGQRAFAARPQLKPVIGSPGRPDAPRVHDDHLFGLPSAVLNIAPHMPSDAPVSVWLQPQFMMQAGIPPPKP